MKLVTALLFSISALTAQNTLTQKEISDGWILLFDGESLFGWTQEGAAKWRIADGAVIADAGDAGWLRQNSTFADYVLKCDFRTGAKGNSGVFLRSAKQGEPDQTGYEVQIANEHAKGYMNGSLVGHVKAAKSFAKPDEWHTLEMEAEGDHFVVKLDGKKILDARDSKSRVGHVGLQYNKDNKVEFRNIKLKPLGLKPIFNGKDLAGWKTTNAPKADQPPVWSVKDGAIHVEKGPGQLETEGVWDDLVLQLDVRTNAMNANHHPNSGVFIRGDHGGFWTGYEDQIRNEYKDGDRTQAVDFGTGGIYNRQPARKVVSNDNEYFADTFVARGRHLAVWINGYPVSDFEDERPEGTNARQQARLQEGTVSLQAHDPTTNLDFKNLRIAALPK